MDTNVIVTVLIATYNRARYIADAILSVQAQTFTQWQIIVLDDASTDDTESIVRKLTEQDPRITYIKHAQNKGIAGNRNAGLALAQSPYVAILDSDDLWTDPRKLEAQIAHLDSHTSCVAIGTQVSVIDENGTKTGEIKYETDDAGIRAHFLRRNQFAQSSIVYRLAAVRAVGGYNGSYTVNDDFDLWLSLGSQGSFANLPEAMAAYREHSGGITKTKKMKAATEHLAIIKKHGRQYPHYPSALLKAYLRILKALI
jgi:glycosyltransferase involved in cell wall biosynthesis